MISEAKYKELLKKGYSLDILWIVQKAKSGEAFEENIPIKLQNIADTAKRKGLITDDFKITLEGEELLKFIEGDEVKLVKKKPVEDPFVQWWSTYPATNTFEYRGRKFKGTRALRVKKEDCKTKLNKILNTGEYTIEELISALKLEVYQKCEDSYKTSQNKMNYMQNSLTYLNQATYDPFVELVRKGFKAEEKEEEESNETFI